MMYVYILCSEVDANRYYVGITANLKNRLVSHNEGKVFHTSKFMPWKIHTYIAFSSEKRAIAFEKYLKTSSGRAFSKKRF